MRLIIANAYFPPFAPGGAEDSLVECIVRFSRQGHEVEVVTCSFDGNIGESNFAGCHVIHVASPVRLKVGSQGTVDDYLKSKLFFQSFVDALVKQTHNNGIEILLANNTHCYRSVAEAGRQRGLDTVAVVRDTEVICSTGSCMEGSPAEHAKGCHGIVGSALCNIAFQRNHGVSGWRPWPGMFMDGLLMGLRRYKVQRSLSQYSRIITISTALERQLLATLPILAGRTRVIPNFSTSVVAADSETVRKFLGSLGLVPGGYVLAAGKKSRGKGSDVLVSSIQQIRADGVHIKALFLGKGQVDIVNCFGVVDHAPVSKELLLGVLKEAVALVVPGRCQEGLHRSMIDALRLGIPVICTDAGGVSEGVQDGVTGRVIPCGNVEALLFALRDVSGWDATRREFCAKAAGKHFENTYSDRIVEKKWNELFDELEVSRKWRGGGE